MLQWKLQNEMKKLSDNFEKKKISEFLKVKMAFALIVQCNQNHVPSCFGIYKLTAKPMKKETETNEQSNTTNHKKCT